MQYKDGVGPTRYQFLRGLVRALRIRTQKEVELVDKCSECGWIICECDNDHDEQRR